MALRARPSEAGPCKRGGRGVLGPVRFSVFQGVGPGLRGAGS